MINSFTWVAGDSAPSASLVDVVPDRREGGWIWVDLSDEGADSIASICSAFGIPRAYIDEALEEASLPMIEEQRDLIYVVLNAFRSTPDGRLEPSEVDFFMGEDFVISIHDGDLVSASTAMERLKQGIGLTAPSPAGLLAQLAMIGSRRMPYLIDHLESQLDSLEELAMRADPRALTEVYALRRDVIVMRRILVPQRQIYEELSEPGAHPLVDEASRLEFERVEGYQTQILESLEAARSLLGSVLETHRGAIADQTNQIVRVLTVFSAILLPLSLVSGIFGMNFVEIPLAREPWGFWLTVGAMALIALILWIYFGLRRFVGTPRLSELPKAVGLGIYQVGSAPIRVVAGGIESTIRRVTGSPRGKDDGADV